MKKKNIKNGLLALGLIAVVGVAGISAYFTATDTATNTFNVQKVDVELTEPNYTDGQQVVPNQTITKDPTVTNTGTTNEFVFVSVKVPYKNLITANADGTRNAAGEVDLFTLNNVSNKWVLVKTNNLAATAADGVVAADGVHEYIYAYATGDAATGTMTALAPEGVTEPVFQSVTMVNAIEGQGLESLQVKIPVDVYAIQSSDLSVSGNGTKVPAEVLNIYLNQNK